MQTVLPLRVPLKVDVKSGDNWAECEPWTSMKTIGVVGGVASGKSLVSPTVASSWGPAFWTPTAPATTCWPTMLKSAPRSSIVGAHEILAADGQIDRRAVAAHVFADTPAGLEDRKFLEDLNSIPASAHCSMTSDASFKAEGRPAVVLDAPLLLEAGWGPMCDFILFVDTPRSTRLAHAKTRGWTEAEFNRREASQWPVGKKTPRRHRRPRQIMDRSTTSAHAVRPASGKNTSPAD